MSGLKTHHCSQCQYDLSGLARAGRCPECGQRYDRDRGVGVLDASALKAVGSAWRRSRFVPSILLVVAAAVMACGLLIARVVQDWQPLRISVVAAAALGMAGWWLHRRQRGG